MDLTERVPQLDQDRIARGQPLDELAMHAILALPVLPRDQHLVEVLERLERAGAARFIERRAAMRERIEGVLIVLERRVLLCGSRTVVFGK